MYNSCQVPGCSGERSAGRDECCGFMQWETRSATSPFGGLMDLRCAFINCQDLFQPGTVANRGPQSPDEMDAKLGALAETLKDAAGSCPDLVGLCEVGDEAVGKELAEAIAPGYYECVWSGPPPAKNSFGLMVLFRRDVFTQEQEKWVEYRRGPRQRNRAMAVPLYHAPSPSQLQGGLLWFAVSHWEAPSRGTPIESDHFQSWMSLSGFCRDLVFGDDTPLILVGDFNCEPWDAPFVNQSGDALETTRERRLVLDRRRHGSFLYNPMWRLAVEMEPFEETLADGFFAPHHHRLGTWNDEEGRWRMFDQLIVTRPLLDGSYLQLQEGTVRIVPARDGCSDHRAVGASFRVLEE